MDEEAESQADAEVIRESKNRRKNIKRRKKRQNLRTASPVRDQTSEIKSTPPDSQSSVDRFIDLWQLFNQVVPQEPSELFDLCLASESLIYSALRELSPLQLITFKRRLAEYGFEIEDQNTHHTRACEFGSLVPVNLLECGIDPEERRRALEKIDFSKQVKGWFGTDPAEAQLHPRYELSQQRRVETETETVETSIFGSALTNNAQERPRELVLESQQEQEQASEREAEDTPDYSEGSTPEYTPVASSASGSESENYGTDDFPSRVDISKEYVDNLARRIVAANEELATARARLLPIILQRASEGETTAVPGTSQDILGEVTPEDVIIDDISSPEIPSEDVNIQTNTAQDTSDTTFLLPKEVALEKAIEETTADGILNEELLVEEQSQLQLPTQPRPLTMPTNVEITLPLPVLPQGWSGDSGKDFKAIGTVTASTLRSVEPVGPYYLAHARRARHKRTFSEDDRIQAQESVKTVEDDDAAEISEPEDPSMLLRDAKDWKGQDHYAVLGLSKYRWRATEEQIKRAHRKKVLRHHPDKKAAAGSTEDDSFFKCIQKATEILLDPVKRRQFDSVDEAADVEPPTKKQSQKGNFYKLWGSVFKAEGRFSRIQPVPKLGDEKSTKEEVDNFYNFWYNFDSWRSFEYQDEDVPDDNENRDQKRHMERKNNNARKKKKTEDSARLRKLLDDCAGLDERIKKFRQEASASKNKKRLEKEAAEKKAAEDAKAKKEADDKAAREAEELAKVEREQGKKAKEAAKNAVKKNKRVLKASVKDANYFVEGDVPAATIDAVLNDVELVQGKVDPDEIAALAGRLGGLKVADEIKAVWSGEVTRLVHAGKLKDGDAKTLVV